MEPQSGGGDLAQQAIAQFVRAPSPAPLVEAWEVLMRRTKLPSLPIALSEASTVEDYELIGYLAAASGTLEDALTVVTQHPDLWLRGTSWERGGDAGTLLRYQLAPRRDRLGVRCVAEAALAQVLHLARLVTRERVTPLLVRFSHAEPHDVRAHREFFGCPVVFRCAEDAIVIDASALSLKIPTAQPGLCDFLKAQALQRRSSQPPSMRLSDRVREIILAREDVARLRSEDVANQLQWSDRSLRRKLDREGTSLRRLLDEVLAERARTALEDGDSVEAVALRLGFESRSAFARAFRRCTGRAPRELRPARS